MYKLICENNLRFEDNSLLGKVDLVYCDPVYEDIFFNAWIFKYWQYLKPSGVFIVQTDFHTLPDIWMFLRDIMQGKFISHSAWKCEWGNHPSRQPHQCFDDILIFAKEKDYKYYPQKVQVPKVTKTKGLNPSGRETKTATAWIDDICLTTTSKERVKKPDGHLLRWQKPIRLFDRIVAPFVDKNDTILDPFMGSGTLCEWAIRNDCNYVGIENDPSVFELAKARCEAVENYLKENYQPELL